MSELFAYTAIAEWGGKIFRIPLADNAIETQRGVAVTGKRALVR